MEQQLDIPAEMLSPEPEEELDTGIDLDQVDETQPGLIEALVEEIKERAEVSKQYIAERDGAKTRTKRELYKKKLEKNNMIAADMLAALEKLVQKRDAKLAAEAELIETNDGEFISPDQLVGSAHEE